MSKKLSLVALIALGLGASQASAAIRIDFADDAANSTPGFRISQNAAGGIADRFELGSDQPNNADNLDFLRITSVSTGATDSINFIIVLPEMRIVNNMGADGVGIDQYSLVFGGGNSTVVNGFKIYHTDDNGLQDVLLQADITLLESMVTVGSSGNVEANPLIGLTNIQLITNNILVSGNDYDGPDFQTLVDFKNDALLGADFVAGIFSAGSVLSQRILANTTTEGSAAGSIESVIPEPGTFFMLAVGAMMAVRSRVNRRRD